jgi:hypothetical protein
VYRVSEEVVRSVGLVVVVAAKAVRSAPVGTAGGGLWWTCLPAAVSGGGGVGVVGGVEVVGAFGAFGAVGHRGQEAIGNAQISAGAATVYLWRTAWLCASGSFLTLARTKGLPLGSGGGSFLVAAA